MGKKNKVIHIRCRRCGRHSYHIRKEKCSVCGYPRAKFRNEGWRWKKSNRLQRKYIKPKNQKKKTSHIRRHKLLYAKK